MTTAITVSERAARRIGQILKTEGDGAMLRISVEGGGCSGFQYKFDVERNRTDDEARIYQLEIIKLRMQVLQIDDVPAAIAQGIHRGDDLRLLVHPYRPVWSRARVRFLQRCDADRDARAS